MLKKAGSEGASLTISDFVRHDVETLVKSEIRVTVASGKTQP